MRIHHLYKYVAENTLDMEQCEGLTRYKSFITFVPNLSHNFKFTTPRHLETLLLLDVSSITHVEKNCFKLRLYLLISP